MPTEKEWDQMREDRRLEIMFGQAMNNAFLLTLERWKKGSMGFDSGVFYSEYMKETNKLFAIMLELHSHAFTVDKAQTKLVIPQ